MKMEWYKDENGDLLTDAGFAIISGYRAYALYRQKGGECYGDPLRVGSLADCKSVCQEVFTREAKEQ